MREGAVKMKSSLCCVLLLSAAGMMQASILESITFDLSPLHAGSTLSGTFALSNSPVPGDTASAQLFFSDPADYSASPLTATITIGNGTFLAYTVGFNDITFTNPSGNMFDKNVDLRPNGMAQCASFPCTATGGFEDGFPAAFTATYAIAPVAAAVPEPGYGLLLVPILLLSFLLGRRVECGLVRPGSIDALSRDVV
jgi:hypothetical protein